MLVTASKFAARQHKRGCGELTAHNQAMMEGDEKRRTFTPSATKHGIYGTAFSNQRSTYEGLTESDAKPQAPGIGRTPIIGATCSHPRASTGGRWPTNRRCR